MIKFIIIVKKRKHMWKSRSELLIGKENIEKLASSHIAIFGLGVA